MSEAVRVAVVIPAFNAGRWIEDQLNGLLNQKDAPPFSVIVADNGSTDNTLDVAGSFSDKLALQCVDASQRKGASHARNVGVRYADADLILFCDADDLVDKNWVASLVLAHGESGADLIAGALHHERFNSPQVLVGYRIPPDPKVDTDTPLFLENPPGFAGYLPTAAGGNMAVTKAAYEAVGGMDPSYPGGSEETAFAWKIQEAGFRIVSCPRAIVHYRLKSRFADIARQQFIQQRARIYLWTQFRGTSMVGPSTKASLFGVLRTLPKLVPWTAGGSNQYYAAWQIGAHLGALAGIWDFRISPRLSETRVISSIRRRNQ